MSSMPISRKLPSVCTGDVVETNLRLIQSENGKLPVRRVRLESNDRCPDLRQKVCSRLRGDRVTAVPSPWDSAEILVPAGTAGLRRQAMGDGWHASLIMSEYGRDLDLRNPTEAQSAAELLQKAAVVELEFGGEYWWLSESTRNWYSDVPATSDEGVMLLPRLSLSTCVLRDGVLGLAYDGGYLLCTEHTVADFLLDKESRRHFDRLRGKAGGRRGTLIYNTGQARRLKCYFVDYANDLTCGSTAQICVQNRRYSSLLDYYQREKSGLDVSADDDVVRVSFEWGKRPVLVAAKLLRLRLQLDPSQMPRKMRRLAMSPESRRKFTNSRWTPTTLKTIEMIGLHASPSLWQPPATETTQLTPPCLLFGSGYRLESPAGASLAEYRPYFSRRAELLLEHGVYRFNPAVARINSRRSPSCAGLVVGPSGRVCRCSRPVLATAYRAAICHQNRNGRKREGHCEAFQGKNREQLSHRFR